MDVMAKVVSLCKRRGFVFPSSEIYGGLRSFYDFGPLGLALKKNIADLWWDYMVDQRDNVVGLDSSIVMHPKVWEASGHITNFTDPLVDCKNCQHRFRADKQPQLEPGTPIVWRAYSGEGRKRRPGSKQTGVVGECGYVCPECGSPHLSEPRPFSGLFRTFIGSIDPLASSAATVAQLRQTFSEDSAYLRPETAQAMFVQFLNIQKSMALKLPFGIAQIGKSFRNEIVVEHFIFRSREFEQMEMEFFCEPGAEATWMKYWCEQRMRWYQSLASAPAHFRLRAHGAEELAHYSDACYDIEYEYPWGWDELEGIASRGDYDLRCHSEAAGVKLQYFDATQCDPQTGKPGVSYVPKVIEPAAGLSRALLCFLLDAYTEEHAQPGQSQPVRTFLKLHPALAPYKAAILPLTKDESLITLATSITRAWRRHGMKITMDMTKSIGRRYARHDEIGTPYAVTVDHDSIDDACVTVRDRDTKEQIRLPIEEARAKVWAACRAPWYE